MLRLSKKADYALMAMKHLAVRGDRGSSSAREIAEQYGIPIELMAKVLQRLVRIGLLASTQGTRGGYTLGRPAIAISVAVAAAAVKELEKRFRIMPFVLGRIAWISARSRHARRRRWAAGVA